MAKGSTHNWCGSGLAVNKSLWAVDEPEEAEVNSCVSLLFEVGKESLTGLYAAHGQLRMPIICQFPLNDKNK